MALRVSASCVDLFFAVYFAVPIVVALAHAKFWVPARYAELERIERELLEKNLSCKFELLKVAGLGTVYVPCTSKTVTSRTKKTLVLVHGYAAGNALWACVRSYPLATGSRSLRLIVFIAVESRTSSFSLSITTWYVISTPHHGIYLLCLI
jgi:hypothetical protein